MDPFQTLPVSIMEMILERMPDLPSLYSLMCASPAIAALLHENDGPVADIVEAIISGSKNGHGLPREAQALIRSTVLLRWGICSSYPLPSNWTILSDPNHLPRRDGWPILPDFMFTPLHRFIPPTVLCRLLVLSTRVRSLSHSCLHDLIARCMALEPSHLKGPNFKHTSVAPSWAEEQRVTRALWWMVFAIELRDAVVVRGASAWSEQEVERLRDLEVHKSWDSLWNWKNYEELMTVIAWAHPTNVSSKNAQSLPLIFSSPMIGKDNVHCCQNTWPITKEEWDYEESCFNEWITPGYSSGTRPLAKLDCFPSMGIDFASSRPFGFALWSTKRMIALGFLEDSNRDYGEQGPVLAESHLFFKLESMLSEELRQDQRKRVKQGQTEALSAF